MNAASLRERIVRVRQDRRRVERDLDRLGMVLVRLAAHRERLARGATATGDIPADATDTGDAVVRAVDRLVQPGDGESFSGRREAFGYLTAELLDPADGEKSGDLVSFFDRAQTYRTGHGVSTAVWRVVAELRGYLGGNRDPSDVHDAVTRLVEGSKTPADVGHLQALVGFAATAARREQTRLNDRLNGAFDGVDVTEPGLLEAYLDAVGDDPLESLEEQPVVLFPVRLETRFVRPGSGPDAAPTVAGDDADGTHELRIRIYPDQVHVDTHEPALTDEEVRWGETFWTLLWLATHPDPASVEPDASDAGELRLDVVARLDLDGFASDWLDRYGELKERAWRQVVERFGRERAAYVVHALRPVHGDEMLGAGEGDESPWGTGTSRVPDLRFPAVDRRPDSWTAQPRARLLPDRWVAHATWRMADDGDGESTIRQVSVASRPVREPLAMGPDPETLGTLADEAIGEAGAAEADESPAVPAGLEWLVDYDEAHRAGMAITLTADDIGFDPTDRGYAPDDHEFAPVDVVVVGVKGSTTGAESAESLRELLDAHHYADGLEFLEAGTPTNNADVPSAYTAADDPVGSMAAEIGAPLVEAGDATDGDRLARALGISPGDGEDHVFAHVGNADRSTDREARHMNNVLWPATVGYSLAHLLVDNRWGPDPSLWADVDDVDAAAAPTDPAVEMREGLALLDAYRRHFVRYVRGGGPFPALRVGEQPYGVLPVTPLSSLTGLEASDLLYDSKLLAAAVAVDEDEETPEKVTEYSTTAASDLDGYPSDAAAVDTGCSNDVVSSADASEESGSSAASLPVEDVRTQTDGSGGFVPRRLARRDDEVVPHLATWLERFAGVWREAVRADAPDEPAESSDDDTDGSAGPRPVPRVGAGVTLVDVLAMEAVAGDYLRKSVFTDALTIWEMVGATDDDITDADLRGIISEADADLTEAELDALLEDFEPPSGRRGHWTRWGRLYVELLAARDRQRQDIRETLRAYDLTGLDPRVAHFLYEDALAGGATWRTISGLVDDDVAVNLWLLQQLPYGDLRRMGYRAPGDGEGSTAATRQWQALVDEQRARYPGTEPVLQKSLLRALLRFATMQEFVNGRITLGALYDDPVALGPDPIHSPDVAYPTWFGQLQYHWIPATLAEHPELTGGAPDDFESGSYLDALEYLRQPGAILSPIPTFSDFTYSLNRLESYPTDRLERLLATTVDLASHRLDAWWTSVATRRLFELRTAQGSWADRHRLEPLSVRLGYRPARMAVAEYESGGGDAGEADGDAAELGGTDWLSDGVAIDEADFDVDTIAGAGEAVTDIDAATGPLAGEDAPAGSDPIDPNASTGSISEVERDPLVGAGTVDGQAAIGEEPVADTWLDDHVELHPGAEPAVYVGGYGFVEDLEPDPVSGDTEFIHAPSVQHATTAAMLRSAHESHEGDALGEALAVDLSADRVRLARGLLEGVRNGQTLGALLGYRFERALHDHHDDLQTYIPAFRQVAPAVMGRLEHGGEPARGEAEPGSTAAKSDVVDGYRLYEKDQAGDLDWGREGLPPDRDVVKAVFDEALARPIDALSDLLTAESVHQLAKGNVERASASMDALVDGRVPQEPEVIRSPRSRTGVTHRQLVLFDAPSGDESPDVPPHWDPSTPVVPDDPDGDHPDALQARHAAEPALTAWVAELLPDPATVSCTVTFRWTDEAGDDHASTTSATLADLALTPLDALYLTQDAARAGTSQLEGRFAYHLRRHPPDEIPDDAAFELELEFTAPAADDDLSVAGFLELAGAIRSLVGNGRPADAEDLAHPADGLGTGHEPAGAGSIHPARRLAARLVRSTRHLEAVRAAIDARLAAFEGTEDDPNLLARVDAATDAVTAFAEAAVTVRAVPGADGTRPSPAERFAVFEQRASTVVERLTTDIGSTGETLLGELERLRDGLPAGPTAPDEVEADLTVEPGVPLSVSGRVVETSDADAIDVEAWSRTPVATFHATVEAVPVAESGAFTATLDLGAVEAGTPFQVIGRVDGEVVYGASGRVIGPTPTPEEFDETLSTELPTVAALLELARVRDRLTAVDGKGVALAAAVADLAIASPSLADELELIRRLDTAGRTTLDDDDRSAIETVTALAEVTGLDWLTALDAVLAPVDRLGLTELVTVSVVDGEPTFRRGADRAAAAVRERLVTTDRDAECLLTGDPPAGLLDVDPAVARYVDDAVSDGGDDLVSALGALVHAPGWFPAYLDGFVDDGGGLLHGLSLLLYDPETFDGAVEPVGFVGELDALAGAVSGMDRLDEVLETDVDGRDAFAGALRSFIDGTGGDGLQGFLESAGWSARGDDAAFAAAYESDLETAETGALSSLLETVEVLGDVLEVDDPARAVRKGVYETVRDRLVWAAYLGVYGSVPVSVDGGDPADEAALVGQLRATAERIATRLEAVMVDDASPASVGVDVLVALGVDALVDRLEAAMGEPFVVLAPFVPPNAPELERAFGPDRLGDDPLAAETWLQRVAHVRERPAAFREALTYAEAATGTLHRDLVVGQLPDTAPGPWVGLEGVEPEPGQVSFVVQAGTSLRVESAGATASSFTRGLTGLFVDEWVEPVPSAAETTGIALNYDDPGARAPQSILVATPPRDEWAEHHLRTAIAETLGLAKLRLVDLEALAGVKSVEGLNHLLPALWFPRVFDAQPRDPSVDFEALERFDPGPDPESWRWFNAVDSFAELGAFDGSSEGDGDATGGDGA